MLHYVFPVRGCRTVYGRTHHDYPATDIFAPRGCEYVAPISGRVDEVTTRDMWSPRVNDGASRGGLSVALVGDDGVRYYGSHLMLVEPAIAPGVRVQAGRVLGLVGNTGDARSVATHVHFGISWPTARGVWWVRRGEVSPAPYLDAWRTGAELSPTGAVAAARKRLGQVPSCEVDC